MTERRFKEYIGELKVLSYLTALYVYWHTKILRSSGGMPYAIFIALLVLRHLKNGVPSISCGSRGRKSQ